MFGRFVKDESGMTMGLAVITMVLIGVMGAGLLTFVSRDLSSVVEVNQGQKALEVADAGVRAAQRQILADSSATTNYDGGIPADTSRWSYCYNNPLCSSASATGSAGMRLDMGSDYATVTILKTADATPTYKVVSEGRVGEARRRVEATFVSAGAVDTPQAFFTYGKLNLTGSGSGDGVSFFAKSDIKYGGAFNLGTANDSLYKRWAQTADTNSYPNDHNKTPRGSAVAGLGSLGTLTCDKDCGEGTRSYDTSPINASTPRMVETYGGTTTDSSKIAFPFKVPSETEDKQTIESLRQRALTLERDKIAAGATLAERSHYIDSVPGNGVDDAGMSTGSMTVTNWYSSNDFATVRFYEYQSYSSSNKLAYGSGDLPNCKDTTGPTPTKTAPKGVIVLQNGDFSMQGNVAFNGGILVRAYDSSDSVLPPPADINTYTNGSYSGSGATCLKGYANSSGNMSVTGDVTLGGLPSLSSITGSGGSLRMIGWRELYQ